MYVNMFFSILLFFRFLFLHAISFCSTAVLFLIHGVSTGGSSRSGGKHPHDELTKRFTDTSRHPPSFKAGYSSKHGPLQSSTKTFKCGTKPGTKMTKSSSAKAPDTVGVFHFHHVKLTIENAAG